MKKYIYLIMAVVIGGIMGACSKDDPFDNTSDVATGRFLKSSINVSVEMDGKRVQKLKRKLPAQPNVGDFKVEFFKDNASTPEVVYESYANMPEIVTLPVGEYTVRASYGENPVAAFDAPYYEGSSAPFTIEQDKITDEVAPIVCKISNVLVTIVLSDELKSVMENDCKITVKVGEQGSLDYTLNDVNAGRIGYFRFVEGSNSLAATFSGTVDGGYTNETKAYDNVEPGNQYSIFFYLHDAGAEGPGGIGGDDIIKVDAKVTRDDLSRDIDDGEAEMTDDMRPQEGNQPGNQEPNVPDQPGDETDGPTITAVEPISFDKVNEIAEIVENDYEVKLIIRSEAEGGIAEFTVNIKSNTLSEEVLTDVGLSANLDLVNPGDTESMLRDLPLPVKEQVKGQHEVVFDITPFMSILASVAQEPDTHYFTLTVKDAEGKTTVKTIVFHNN